ncbi:23S rRNA (adenine(2030)-N(6))-methyltransferase RlmJ [Fertoebacter nigrum]|uniref:Ribosomal RNA large subunit methyltransferase J n=1 Tax=Fertoeibacter niger TaxID=2656921 RepID=A0A8X8KNS7_9RHOB|nr:23S rRNA (adenine(2030)-N(6))-methyltransferase RlmJ [Fertoeibacter niger]NUB44106.1 23S rRNA (adenine(2030)-N(6))-methyltransferase RlmJ [Fertoeibacter niger]
MLSYQHHFHAGNLADVHKHALLCHMLDYMAQKDKPLTYIETHAGRGLYDLDAAEAAKTGEAAQGIGVLEQRLAPDHPYRLRLAEVRARHGAAAYPGSPLLAVMTLREQDTLHLAELHPQEHRILSDNLAPWGAHIHQQDGFQMALAIAPPTPRRGLMLVDPSYEVKADYLNIPSHLAAVARKWNVGTLALWYPLLANAPHRPMTDALHQTFPEALCHEVRFPPAREGHRMLGSGLFIVNPPYGTAEQTAELTRVFSSL